MNPKIIKVRFEKKAKVNRTTSTLKHRIIYKKLIFLLIIFIAFILINLKEKPNNELKEISFIRNKTKNNDTSINPENFEKTDNISSNNTEIEKADNITEIEKTDNILNNSTEIEKTDNIFYNNTKSEKIDKIVKKSKKPHNNKINGKTLNKVTNYIHLALNIDNKYSYPCIVSLTSLLINRAHFSFYIIHILIGNDVKNETLDKIKLTIEEFGNNYCNVSFYRMGDQFRGATATYVSIAAYYRIALPSLLPNVDKIIYTDSDVINFKDLSEMYNIKLKENIYFCGPLDYSGHLDELKRLGIITDKYMNSGILIMNLKAMRKDNIEKKLRNYVSSHFLNHFDQTAINAVCRNNTQILSYKYGAFAFNNYKELLDFNNGQNSKYKYSISELNQSFYDPTLLHFPGFVKPWQRGCKFPQKVFWWYFAKKSIFYQEILDHYGFNKLDIDIMLNNSIEYGNPLKLKIKTRHNSSFNIENKIFIHHFSK